MPKIRILSIDGGGVRGVIPARVMQAIEERAGKPLYELFDYFVGTSTGGVLTMGSVLPNAEGKARYTAKEGVEFFLRESPRIFPPGWIYSVRQMFTHKYPSTGVETVFRELFGNAVLGDALKPAIVTAYATNFARPKVFKSFDALDSTFAMHDVARATSAAPTFFEPVTLSNPRYPLTLVDGGVFANNPAMCGLADATKQHPDVDLSEIMVVSLGAGETDYDFTRRNILQWGALQWITGLRILHLFMDGSIDAVSYQLKEMLRRGFFYRVQTELSDKLSSMDDSRNVPDLLKVGEALVREQSAVIDTIVETVLR